MNGSFPVRIPKVTMAATECTFIAWLVADGDEVTVGAPLYTVATDKVEVEVPSLATGILRHGDALAEASYPVETVIGVIELNGG